MADESKSLVFFSYASPDRERVLLFADYLTSIGVDVWIDCRRIKGGQNWDIEIKRALDRATIIVVFISKNSLNRRGYVQREIKLALDKAEEKLLDDIFIIPVRLDGDAAVPEQLKHLHFVTDSDQLEDAIRHQFERVEAEVRHIQDRADVRWTSLTQREVRDGIPGYEIDVQTLRFSSDKYRHIDQITDYIRGALLESVMRLRADAFEPVPDLYNFGQESFRRTNTLDVGSSSPRIVGRVMSVVCAIHWYGAGAAHPNMGFQTFTFMLDPIFLIASLEVMFEDPQAALVSIQNKVRGQLLSERAEDGQPLLFDDQVLDGTKAWTDFRSFAFDDKGVEFLFAPYQVGAYAAGPQTARIEFEVIAPLLKPAFRSALGVEHFLYRK
jgi:hypothetical protein